MLSTQQFKPADVSSSEDVQRLENFGLDGKLDVKSVKAYSDGKPIPTSIHRLIERDWQVHLGLGVLHCWNPTATILQHQV